MTRWLFCDIRTRLIVATANCWLFLLHRIRGTIILEFLLGFFPYTQFKCQPYLLCFHIENHTNHSPQLSFLFRENSIKEPLLCNCCFSADWLRISRIGQNPSVNNTRFTNTHTHSTQPFRSRIVGQMLQAWRTRALFINILRRDDEDDDDADDEALRVKEKGSLPVVLVQPPTHQPTYTRHWVVVFSFRTADSGAEGWMREGLLAVCILLRRFMSGAMLENL